MATQPKLLTAVRARIIQACMAITALALAGCAGQAAGPGAAGPAGGAETAAPPASAGKTVTVAIRYEPTALAPKAAVTGLAQASWRTFNAGLFLIDSHGTVRPYLASAVPQLDSADWQVFPDGRMDVTYRLQPGLTWHDGQPLTADDFRFAYRAYSEPGLGIFSAAPQNLMMGVDVADPQTFVIHWSQPYPQAAAFVPGDFEPLPRHTLESALVAFEADPAASRDALVNHPYWTQQFIGAGPYRLARWDPGAEIDGAAFAGHALGQPKIDHIILRLIADENTTLTNLLAGTVQLASDFTMRYEQATVLQQNWGAGATPGGAIFLYPLTLHLTMVQMRPDYLKAPPLLDLRVRQAMVATIDRDGLNQALFNGQGLPTESVISNDAPYFATLDHAITHNPYDPRRAAQLMADAGFTKDASATYASAAGEEFAPDLWTEGGTQFERELTLMTTAWRGDGFNVQPYVLPAEQVRDNQTRATFPALSTTSTGFGERNVAIFASAQIGSPANRWAGTNRGGWSNPDYDRIYNTFTTTLDPAQRQAQVIQMAQLTSENLPAYLLYFNLGVLASAASLTGPERPGPDSLDLWNLYAWELT